MENKVITKVPPSFSIYISPGRHGRFLVGNTSTDGGGHITGMPPPLRSISQNQGKTAVFPVLPVFPLVVAL